MRVTTTMEILKNNVLDKPLVKKKLPDIKTAMTTTTTPAQIKVLTNRFQKYGNYAISNFSKTLQLAAVSIRRLKPVLFY